METTNQNVLSVFAYQGNNITFKTGNGVMVNATQMAKPFGDSKRAKNWLALTSTREFLDVLTKGRNLPLAELLVVIKGGANPGTWMHEDVALEFARWLSPVFGIWCNDRIKELLSQGVATISDDDVVIAQAMDVLQRRLKAQQVRADYEAARAERLELQTTEQQKQLQAAAPKVQYYEDVLSSASLVTVNQIALELGISAMRLNQILCEKQIQYRQSNTYLLFAKYRNKGYARSIPYTHTDKFGVQHTRQHLYWTEGGKEFILSLLKK